MPLSPFETMDVCLVDSAKPLLGYRKLTERFVNIGLAPEIPEDLYMLIKKVRKKFRVEIPNHELT